MSPYVDFDDFSEFEGGGVMPNGVFPRAIPNASDQLRLMSTTGQTEDTSARRNHWFFLGQDRDDILSLIQGEHEREVTAREMEEDAVRRYRQSPDTPYRY